MLEFLSVSKKYATSNVFAVDSLNMKVNDGEIFGFLGPNGAGKSTTIKMATGILNIEQGDILINGKSIKTDAIEAKKEIGYVSDNHTVYDKLTGYEYLSFIGSVFGIDSNIVKERTEKYAQMFQLESAMKDQILSYSHGMKQKISVMAALIHNPKLWILDEPLTGLDPQSVYELKQLMRKHADEGNTVFFSSHVIDVVEKICDRVGIINKGKLITVGTMDEIKARSQEGTLEESFLDITAFDKEGDGING